MGSHDEDTLFGADFQPNIDSLFQEAPFLSLEDGNINLRQPEPCVENAVLHNELDQSNSELLSNGLNGDTQHGALASDQQLEFQHTNGAPPPSTHAQNGIAENGTASTQQPVLVDQNWFPRNGISSTRPVLIDQNWFLRNGTSSTQQPVPSNGNFVPQNGTASTQQPVLANENGFLQNGTTSTQPVLANGNSVLQNGTASTQPPVLANKNGFHQNGIASTQPVLANENGFLQNGTASTQPVPANENAAPQNGTALDSQPGPSSQNTAPQKGTDLNSQPEPSGQNTAPQNGKASKDQPKRLSDSKKRYSDSSGSDGSNKSAKRSNNEIPAPNPEDRTREQLQEMVDDRDAKLKKLRSNLTKLSREHKTVREHRDLILAFCASHGLNPNNGTTPTTTQTSRPIQPHNSAPYQGQPSAPMYPPGYSNPAFGSQPPAPQGMWVPHVYQNGQYAQQQRSSTWTMPPPPQQAPPPPGRPHAPVNQEHTVPSRPADQEVSAQPSAQPNRGFLGGIKKKAYSWLPQNNHMVPGHDVRTSVAEMAKPAKPTCSNSHIKGNGKAKNTCQNGNQPPPAPAIASDPAPPPAPVQAPATAEDPIVLSSPNPPRQESPVATTPTFMNEPPPPVEEATTTLKKRAQNDNAGDNVPRNALGETDQEETERMARQMEESFREEDTGNTGTAQEFDPDDHDDDGCRSLFYGE